MNCADFELLLSDYIDGTLPAAQMEAFEEHQRTCPGCAEFAADAIAGSALLRAAEPVQPPPELLARIAFEIPTGGMRRSWKSQLFGWIQPILQPRFAMGMAMTI